MFYVYSTATCSGTYCLYDPASKRSGHNVAKKKVTIKGGHKVATPYRNFNNIAVHTSIGVVTSVSDEDMEFLLLNKKFQKHVAEKWLCYDKKNVAPEVKAKNMATDDGSTPLTPKDYDVGANSTPDAPIYKANLEKNSKAKVM